MQGIGFSVTGAPTAGAQALDRVIRHIGAGDVFPGTLCTVHEAQSEHQTILEQFLAIVRADNRNRAGNGSTQPGLNFLE
jgi:hypothetical protein